MNKDNMSYLMKGVWIGMLVGGALIFHLILVSYFVLGGRLVN